MSEIPRLTEEAAAEVHNRPAKQIVDQIVHAPIAAGGTTSDVMMLFESVLVGVVLASLPLGHDVKVLDLVVGRVKERLAKMRLGELCRQRQRMRTITGRHYSPRRATPLPVEHRLNVWSGGPRSRRSSGVLSANRDAPSDHTGNHQGPGRFSARWP